MRNGKEVLSRAIAVAGLGITIVALLLYSASGSPLLLATALVGALATFMAALWYFLERGKRLTEMQPLLEAVRACQRDRQSPHEVLVEMDGVAKPGRIWRHNGAWQVQVAGESFRQDRATDGSVGDGYTQLARFGREVLAPRGMRLRCCGTCLHLAFSGMSRRVSNGWVGYCLLYSPRPVPSQQDTVHLWHLCPDWKPAEK